MNHTYWMIIKLPPPLLQTTLHPTSTSTVDPLQQHQAFHLLAGSVFILLFRIIIHFLENCYYSSLITLLLLTKPSILMYIPYTLILMCYYITVVTGWTTFLLL